MLCCVLLEEAMTQRDRTLSALILGYIGFIGRPFGQHLISLANVIRASQPDTNESELRKVLQRMWGDGEIRLQKFFRSGSGGVYYDYSETTCRRDFFSGEFIIARVARR